MRAFWFGMAVHLWQTTLVLAALLLLDRLMHRAPARHRHLLWSAGLAKLLVPFPLLAFLWPSLLNLGSFFEREPAVGTALVTLGRIAQPSILVVASAEAGASYFRNWPFVLMTLLWGAGVTLLMLRWWWRSHHATFRESEPWHAVERSLEKIESAAKLAGVSLARLRIADDPVVPCLRRLLRPLVVLPRAVVEVLEPEELRAILLHEEAHRIRKDLWTNAMQALATRLFFFYPPVWWLSRRLRQTAEMACDEAVVHAGVDPPAYARALARTVQLGLAPSSASALTGSQGSQMRERLARLQSPERYLPMTRYKLYISCAFVLALVFSLAPRAGAGNLAVPPGVPALTSALSAPGAQDTVLDKLAAANRKVSLSVREQALADVIDQVAKLAGFSVTWDGARPATPTSIIVSDAAVQEVLALLAEGRNIEFEVTDPSTLVVASRPYNVIRLRKPAEETEPEPSAPTYNVIRLREPAEETAPEPSDPNASYRVVGVDQEPQRTFYVAPQYPDEARRAGTEGTVVIEATIDKQGGVKSTKVTRGLDPLLDQAAVDAVKQWKYAPTLIDGEPVEVVVTITVRFRLAQSQ